MTILEYINIAKNVSGNTKKEEKRNVVKDALKDNTNMGSKLYKRGIS